MMAIEGVSGLAGDIAVSFGLPILFICLASANIAISSRRKRNYAGLKLRLSLIFSIGLFVYLITSLMFQDRLVLASIWQGSPLLYSFVFSLSGLLVFSGITTLAYWKLRPQLWRRNDNELEK
jgi:hypothetical protein